MSGPRGVGRSAANPRAPVPSPAADRALAERFGLILWQARRRVGRSQRQIAERVGVSVTLICAYERGRRTPKLERLVRLADALGLFLGDLNPLHTELYQASCAASVADLPE